MQGQGLLTAAGTLLGLGLCLGAVAWTNSAREGAGEAQIALFFTMAGAALGTVGLALLAAHALRHPGERWASSAMLGGVLLAVGATILVAFLVAAVPGYGETCEPGGRRNLCSIAKALQAMSPPGLALGAGAGVASLAGGFAAFAWGLRRKPQGS